MTKNTHHDGECPGGHDDEHHHRDDGAPREGEPAHEPASGAQFTASFDLK